MLRRRGISWPRPTALNLRHSRSEKSQLSTSVTPDLRLLHFYFGRHVPFANPSDFHPPKNWPISNASHSCLNSAFGPFLQYAGIDTALCRGLVETCLECEALTIKILHLTCDQLRGLRDGR